MNNNKNKKREFRHYKHSFTKLYLSLHQRPVTFSLTFNDTIYFDNHLLMTVSFVYINFLTSSSSTLQHHKGPCSVNVYNKLIYLHYPTFGVCTSVLLCVNSLIPEGYSIARA